jgi:hypothetical protein
MSGNSYRNNRNAYRRKRRNENRGLVAVVVVTIMAAGIMGAYGFINLFMGDSGSNNKSVASTGAAVNTAENGSSSSSTASGSKTASSETAKASSSDVSKEDTKTVASKTDKKKDTEEKTDIKKLVTASKEAEEDYYKDTVFIGDSRTQGLQINAGLTSPDFFAGRGLNVKNARTEKVVKNAAGKAVTVIDALKDKQYKKVYICFGINELGWPYTNIFADEYQKTIDAIKKIQPNAEVVVQGILPVTEKKSKSDKIFNMKNVKKFNKVIKKMAEDNGETYVDNSPAVANDKGYLPGDVTPDGIHMNREYCKRILAYIVNMNY